MRAEGIIQHPRGYQDKHFGLRFGLPIFILPFRFPSDTYINRYRAYTLWHLFVTPEERVATSIQCTQGDHTVCILPSSWCRPYTLGFLSDTLPHAGLASFWDPLWHANKGRTTPIQHPGDHRACIFDFRSVDHILQTPLWHPSGTGLSTLWHLFVTLHGTPWETPWEMVYDTHTTPKGDHRGRRFYFRFWHLNFNHTLHILTPPVHILHILWHLDTGLNILVTHY